MVHSLWYWVWSIFTGLVTDSLLSISSLSFGRPQICRRYSSFKPNVCCLRSVVSRVSHKFYPPSSLRLPGGITYSASRCNNPEMKRGDGNNQQWWFCSNRGPQSKAPASVEPNRVKVQMTVVIRWGYVQSPRISRKRKTGDAKYAVILVIDTPWKAFVLSPRFQNGRATQLSGHERLILYCGRGYDLNVPHDTKINPLIVEERITGVTCV